MAKTVSDELEKLKILTGNFEITNRKLGGGGFGNVFEGYAKNSPKK